MSRRLILAAAAVGVFSAATASAQTIKEYDTSVAAIPTGHSHIEGGATPLVTGFEPPPVEVPGFNPGPLNGQAGWTVFAATPLQPQVMTANPQSGVQHIRIVDTTAVANSTLTGGFSPTVATPPNTQSLTTFALSINNAAPGPNGGADYHIVGQAPSQGFLTWRVNFDFQGNIRVLDDPDGPGPAPLAFQNTGATWGALMGQYMNFAVEFDPLASSIVYKLNGTTIYTGNNIFAGTAVEQVILASDNFFLPGEFGDYDNLNVGPIPEPATMSLLGLAGLALRRRRR